MGNDCGLQIMSNDVCSCRTIILPFESDENVGAFAPTGSKLHTISYDKNWDHHIYNILYELVIEDE